MYLAEIISVGGNVLQVYVSNIRLLFPSTVTKVKNAVIFFSNK